jgi:hypothetical protein
VGVIGFEKLRMKGVTLRGPITPKQTSARDI